MSVLLRITLLGSVLGVTLAGCGGGGGVSSTPAPPSVTTPPQTSPDPPTTPVTPTPPVSTTPTIIGGGVNDTVEYRDSTGARQANAIVAYNAGFTGTGVTAAIIDTGIDTSNPEFAGRISSASTSTAGNGTIKDEGGHGTAVAGILAAAKNDAGVLGIAYGATLLVARSDMPGSCAKSDGCKHDDNAIARGVELAISNRARVINISLGGDPANAILQAALSRATAAGIVVVISAGNDAAAQPDDFSAIANNATVAKGLVIVAGATDPTGAIASFSNRAGSAASHYLGALGVRMRSYDQTGAEYLYSGTSFSAPLISGAVALLAQAFPNLTGAQIVSLLLSSADDAGAAGIDPVYGAGRLNLVRAFAPRGGTALAGSAVPVSLGDNGTLSAPIGDATGRGGQGTGVILDGYGRAYALDLGATLHRAIPRQGLASALSGGARSVSLAGGGMAMAMSIARAPAGATEIRQLSLGLAEANGARAIAGLIASRIGNTGVALGFGQSATSLDDRLAGRRTLPFLVAGEAVTAGFDTRQGAALALSRRFGHFRLGLSAEQGETRLPLSREDLGRREWRGFGYDRLAIDARRRFGPITLGLAATRLRETSTMLGAHFGGVFGGGGATSHFVDASAVVEELAGWRLTGTMRRGWTRTDRGGAALAGGRFATRAYSVDLARDGVFVHGDDLAFRLAQPLRVARGGYALTLPTGYDYPTGATTTQVTRIDLAPRGREIDAEAAWGVMIGPGWLATNVYWRRDPGNVATSPNDLGMAIRYGFAL